MVNIENQIAYWRDGAREDWAVAKDLVDRGRVRHGLFFAHLALEKALKAHVCAATHDLAPRLHNLLRLAELAGMPPSPAHKETLSEMNPFALEGRYPEALLPPPAPHEAQEQVGRAEEVFRWLMR